MFEFVWQNRRNRICFFAAIGLPAALWFIFKAIYVYPHIVFDSYSYVGAAVQNLKVSVWPIGYSQFLRLFGLLSHSSYLLVSCQFFLLTGSFIYFYFSWMALFNPGRITRSLVFIGLFCNPLWLYCSNFILADALFVSLSVVWITQLFWIVARPKIWMFFVQALLLFLVFTVRYNALYYPVICLLAMLFSPAGRLWRCVGFLLPLMAIGIFTVNTCREVKRISGTAQFSAFGGWKIANDALLAYGHVEVSEIKPVPIEYQRLDSFTRAFYRSNKDWEDMALNDGSSGSFFMFDLLSPLCRYFDCKWPYFGTTQWYKMAPLYQSYGVWLIRQYPEAFGRYFLLPNLGQYFLPLREVFGSPVPYELHESFGGPYLRTLLGIRNIEIDKRYVELAGKIAYPYPVIFTIFHVLFILGLAGFSMSKGFRGVSKTIRFCMLLMILLWLCDFGFSIVSAGIVLRYQFFMSLLELSFGAWMIEYTLAHLDEADKHKSLQIIPD